MGEEKLTKAQLQILGVLADRSLDVFDLSDAAHQHPQRAFDNCASLKARRLVDWMYPEDEVSINDAGRAALTPEPSHD